MSLATHLKYQQAVFHGLHFTPCTLEYGTLWSNAKHPEHGSCLVCERPIILLHRIFPFRF